MRTRPKDQREKRGEPRGPKGGEEKETRQERPRGAAQLSGSGPRHEAPQLLLMPEALSGAVAQ